MIEFYVWIVSLFLVTIAHIALYYRYNVNPHKLAVPSFNAQFMRRMTITNAITYLSFAVFGVFAIFAYPAELAVGLGVAKSWWIVEVFIAWNIRTAFLIFINLGRLKVSV